MSKNTKTIETRLKRNQKRLDHNEKINSSIKLWQAILKSRFWRRKVIESTGTTDALKIDEINK